MGMTNHIQTTLEAMIRQDFVSFTQRVFDQIAPGRKFSFNLAVDATAYALEQVRIGARKRQIIALPPRSLKSMMASVAWPAFILGHDPRAKITCISYSDALASLHSAHCRDIMKSDWYRRLFPRTVISPLKDTEGYFTTTSGGYRDSTSIAGTLTGKGGDHFVIDDPIKPDDAYSEIKRERVIDWYRRTLVSRLDDKARDAIVIVMQRVHPNDLVGHVTRSEAWHQLILPAVAEQEQLITRSNGHHFLRFPGHVLDPVREPLEILEQLKREMLPADFSAQYQQDPAPIEGDLIKWRWFGSFDREPEKCTYTQSWDFASKDSEFSAYSVCTTWAVSGDRYYLVDVFRKRLGPAEMLQAVIDQALRWKITELLIEDAAMGMYLLPRLRLEAPIGVPRPISIKAEGDKVTRLHGVAIVIEQGRVYIKQGASWLKDLQLELAQFPRGKFSDQVDSISQFLKRAEGRRLHGCTAERRPMFTWR